MKTIAKSLVSISLFALCHGATTKRGAKPIIIDTDIYGDVDDVGALAIANVLHNCGLADIRGIAIDTHSKYGALAVSAINTYFGNGIIPVAALRPLTDEIWTDTHFFNRGDFASKIAMNFPRDLKSSTDTATPAELYQEILEAAKDDSLTIVSIGFLNNIADLLNSTRTKSLLASKVHELVIMGGKYPKGWEYNFGHQNPASTAQVLESWPENIPITYIGFELGIDIISGGSLRNASPPDSPILAAYEWYVGRCSTTRESWDPITMLYGILGLDRFDEVGLEVPFEYANQYGYNSVTDASGTNVWVNDTKVTNQHWLKLVDGVSNSTVAATLDGFYVHDPTLRSCDWSKGRHQEL